MRAGEQSEGREEHTQGPRWGRSSAGVGKAWTWAAPAAAAENEQMNEAGQENVEEGDGARLGVPWA